METHIKDFDECYTCVYYQAKTFFCNKFLKGRETSVHLCSSCKSKNEEMHEVPKYSDNFGTTEGW